MTEPPRAADRACLWQPYYVTTAREREREIERETETERVGERERECVCVGERVFT